MKPFRSTNFMWLESEVPNMGKYPFKVFLSTLLRDRQDNQDLDYGTMTFLQHSSAEFRDDILILSNWILV